MGACMGAPLPEYAAVLAYASSGPRCVKVLSGLSQCSFIRPGIWDTGDIICRGVVAPPDRLGRDAWVFLTGLAKKARPLEPRNCPLLQGREHVHPS